MRGDSGHKIRALGITLGLRDPAGTEAATKLSSMACEAKKVALGRDRRWKKMKKDTKKGKGFERIRKDWKWREMIGNLLWKASLLQGLPNLIRHFLCHWGLSRSFLAPLSRAPRPHPGSVAASARLDDAAAWRSLQGVWPLRCPVQKASKTIF